MCKWTDIIHMYLQKVVYKELDELMWMRMVLNCRHEEECTQNM